MAKAEYRSAIRSRQLIHDALAELLEEKSWDKITVADIVRRANINRGTFYAHYDNVPDVIQRTTETGLTHVLDIFSHAPTMGVGVEAALRESQRIMEQDMAYARAILTSDYVPELVDHLYQCTFSYMDNG